MGTFNFWAADFSKFEWKPQLFYLCITYLKQSNLVPLQCPKNAEYLNPRKVHYFFFNWQIEHAQGAK